MLDISDGCIWNGSKPVARLDPKLLPSEIDAINATLNPVYEPDEATFEYQEVKEILGKLRIRAVALAKAGNVTVAELSDLIEELIDEEIE